MEEAEPNLHIVGFDNEIRESDGIQTESLLRRVLVPETLTGLAITAANPLRQLKIASALGRNLLGIGSNHDDSDKRVVLENNGRNHLFIITEPVEGDKISARNTVLLPGLTEMADAGSASRLHRACADYFPERRIITCATEGISHAGELRKRSREELRRLEHMAADTMRLLPQITHDGEIEFVATSLGSRTGMSIAEQNLAANSHEMINLDRLKLVASAVIACNVPTAERFYTRKVSEAWIRAELTQRFIAHVGPDLGRMALTNPVEVAECSSVMREYALYPNKAPSRLRAILDDFKDVQKGVDWEVLKQVSSEYQIMVLGGSRDPLIQWQIPQWAALSGINPGKITQRVLRGKGHLLTIDAAGTVQELAELETVAEKKQGLRLAA